MREAALIEKTEKGSESLKASDYKIQEWRGLFPGWIFSQKTLVFGGLGLFLGAMILIGIGNGPVEISPGQILAIVARKLDISIPVEYARQQESVLWAIRLPRVLLGILVGAGLALAGTLLQGLFRNPLAEPSLLGISSGAALFAVGMIVLGDFITFAAFPDLRLFALPLAAFVGGMTTIFLVYRIGKRRGCVDTSTILLAGIAVNALAGAGIGFLTFLADDTQLRNIAFWSLGSLGNAAWQNLAVAGPLMILPLFGLKNLSRRMNVLLLGDSEAAHLGIEVNRLKRRIIIIVALTVGAGVSVTGIIGFVGLLVPHLLRLTVGADHRILLPASALLGAGLLLGADWLSRTIVAPAELPIGVVTAFIGAPFFLWLLLRKNNGY
ncbi:MAG: iron ABC transporter permease [Pyrinomonadaceae bacterium]